MEQDLQDRGYNRESQSIKPESNQTGQFDYKYKDDKGNQASISGNMKDGEMEELKKFTTEDMVKELQNNKDYQQALQELAKKGFEPEYPQFNPDANQLSQNFKNPETGDRARITANYDFDNQTLANFTRKMQDQKLESQIMNRTTTPQLNTTNSFNQSNDLNKQLQELDKELQEQGFKPEKMDFTRRLNQSFSTFSKRYFNNQTNETRIINGSVIEDKVIELETGEEKAKKKSNWPLILILIIITITAAVIIYNRFFSKAALEDAKARPKPINFRKIALKKLKLAEELYEQKRYKDAYGTASEALRYFHSYKHGTRTELTSTDTISLLKKKKVAWKNTRKALNLANMVEFAKYKPNRKDFGQILKLARNEIL